MNRHEYEINQLINPKKDIVKSNSKHRDKIETLIQGRNGIQGGDVSPTKRDRLIWFVYSGTGGFAGKLTPSGVFEILHHDTGGTDLAVYIDKTYGMVVADAGPLNNVGFISAVIAAATAVGVEITQVVAGVVSEIGQVIPDWEQYEILN